MVTKKKKLEIKFSRTRRIMQAKFEKIEQLNKLFGPNWDIVHNGTSVGFCCPTITFRLLETTITNFKTPLSDSEKDLNAIEESHSSTFHCISVSFYRSSVSRWSTMKDQATGRYVEALYVKKVREAQKISRKLAKKRTLNYKKNK